jgi:hypothetical protein
MFSGGIGSWAAADRVIAEHGRAGVTLLFADVKGTGCECGHQPEQHINGRGPCNIITDVDEGTYCGCTRFTEIPFVGEDPDCYRFIEEASKMLDVELVTLREGRNVWQVFKDNRFLGNSRLANCSKFLKQYPARDWLADNCDPGDTIVYVGIGWDESHRMAAINAAYDPYPVHAPMCDAPFLDRAAMLQEARKQGLTPPQMYETGYAHANCQGACVRAGQAQWKLLLENAPATYAYHEREEQKLRDYLGADVAILKDRTGYTATPLTLRGFRERIESQPSLFDDLEWGGCGCFVDDGPDLPDTPLLEGSWWLR